MRDIDYIVKRIEQIYFGHVDDVKCIVREYERTYELTVILRGVNCRRKSFEIDKKIESIADTINYICNELDK